MDFLLKHYEKLILAFCLVSLLAGMFIVLLSMDKNTSEIQKQTAEASRYVSGGEILKKADIGSASIDDILTDKTKILNILGDSKAQTPKGSLIAPVKMIVCSKKECGNLLAYNMDVCPFCGTKQPEIQKESPEGHDTDSDGIPDSVEKKHEFLNYRDPTDAAKDQDNDGFSNLEEYKAGTKMDDATDFPRLALRFKCVAVTRPIINVRLEEIETNRKDDKSKWEIYFSIPKTPGKYRLWVPDRRDPSRQVPNRQAWRRTTTLLNGDANDAKIGDSGFKLVDASIEGTGDQMVQKAVIQSIQNPEEKYDLIAKADPVLSSRVQARIIFLENRDEAEYNRILRRSRFIFIGDEIEAQKNKGETPYSEYYRLLAADEATGVCRVGYLDEKGGKVLSEFEVPKFDRETDLIKSEARGGEALDEMMNDAPRKGRERRPAGR